MEDQKQYISLIEKAHEYAQRGFFYSCLRCLDIEDARDDGDNLLRGFCYLENQQEAELINLFDTVVTMKDEDCMVGWLSLQSYYFSTKKDYYKAATIAQEALCINKQAPRALFDTAENLFLAGRQKAAERYFESLLSLCESNPEAKYLSPYVFFYQNDIIRTIGTVTDILLEDSTALSWLLAADIYALVEEYSLTEHCLKESFAKGLFCTGSLFCDSCLEKFLNSSHYYYAFVENYIGWRRRIDIENAKLIVTNE